MGAPRFRSRLTGARIIGTAWVEFKLRAVRPEDEAGAAHGAYRVRIARRGVHAR